MTAATFDIPNPMSGITIKARLSGGLRFRMWLAAKIVALAGRVAGCRTEIEIDAD
jgi:hypothetical protein